MHDHPHTEPKQPQKAEHAHHAMPMNHGAPMGHTGHDHDAMMINDFRTRFYVVLILTIISIL